MAGERTTYPHDFLYDETHEWLRVAGEVCTVGITEFAQSEVAEIVFVDLPEVGKRFEARATVGEIESGKAVFEIYAPVAGEVVEINAELKRWPALLNEDPHGKGWMFKLRYSSPDDLKRLMSPERYEELVQRLAYR
jgi:glycine cleavage system H protein